MAWNNSSLKNIKIGLRQKVFATLAAMSVLTVLVGMIGFISIQVLLEKTRVITSQELPRLTAIHETVEHSIHANVALNDILNVDSFEDFTLLQEYESEFRGATLEFNMFLKALLFGSESTEFKNFSSGLILAEWNRYDFEEKIAVPEPTPGLAELIIKTEDYYQNYSNSAQKAITEKRKTLRLQSLGEIELAAQAAEKQKIYQGEANHFFALGFETLNDVIKNTGVTVSETVDEAESFQVQQRLTIVLVTLFGFLLSVLISIIFATRVIIYPIRSMMDAVFKISSGDLSKRIDITSTDEIGQLGEAFNSMTTRLGDLYTNLEQKVEERTKAIDEINKDMKKNIATLEKFQKLTVNRELKMIELKKEIQECLKQNSSE